MLLKIAGAAAGALAGNYVFDSFVVKKGDGSGFIEQTEGFGIDDILHWALVGTGAYFGMRFIGGKGA